MADIQDLKTQRKWDNAAPNFDLMAGRGAEKRWGPAKRKLYSNMRGDILFLALGTGLDIQHFPPNQRITTFDISPKMLEQARPRIAGYEGTIEAQVLDVHNMPFEDDSFDQIFTACTFCSVPRPVEGLVALKRVLKPGGQLFMFEHTGSRVLPFRPMMSLMSLLSEKLGPAMDRDTVSNVQKAGFEIDSVNNLFLDVVKIINARKPSALAQS